MEKGPSTRTLVTYFGTVTVFLLIFLWMLLSKIFFSTPLNQQFLMSTIIALVGTGYYFRTTYRAYFTQALRLRLYTVVAAGVALVDFMLSFRT